MNVAHLSTTLVSNYPQCPSRAWRSYERRLEYGDDNEGTDPTRFGTVVHGSLEDLHADWAGLDVEPREFINLITDEFLIETFDRNWKRGSCYDFDFYMFGKDKVASFMRRSLVNRLGKTVYTELDFVLEVETNKVWLPANGEERKRYVNEILRRGNTPVASKIDRIDRIELDGGRVRIEVTDYKSNILPFTRDEIENSRQLGLYDIVVRVLFPEADEFECIYDMLRWGRFPVTFSDEFRSYLRSYFTNLWSQIAAAEVPEERLNKYCRWCERRSECAVYKAALYSEIPTILTETTDTPEGIDAMYSEYERLADIVKLVEERKKEISLALSAKIEKDAGVDPLPVGNMEYYLQQNPRYEYF